MVKEENIRLTHNYIDHLIIDIITTNMSVKHKVHLE